MKFHPHMARHTYATELLKKGIGVYYVSRLLGHEDLGSTQVYLHPSQQDAIESVKGVSLFEKDRGSNSSGTTRYGLEGVGLLFPIKGGNWSCNPFN
ncbi:MAG: tyrosine-type recombinase/integrase [Cuniculiplasma sp.]